MVSFTVGSSVAQNVAVTITYNDPDDLLHNPHLQGHRRSHAHRDAPSISKLAPRRRRLHSDRHTTEFDGGSAITWYQYSINGGKTWIAFAKGSRSINVVKLAQGHAYRVYTRALNAVGASLPSLSKVVVTRS